MGTLGRDDSWCLMEGEYIEEGRARRGRGWVGVKMSLISVDSGGGFQSGIA